MNKINNDDNNNRTSKNNSILIMDTGADQSTCGGSAWIPIFDTGERVRCNGYYQGKDAKQGPIVPIMSLVTCIDNPNEEPVLLLIHQACYIKDDEQTESLCLPYQAMDHGVTFDLTPSAYSNELGDPGKQCMRIEDREFSLQFDGRKTFVNIRRPSQREMDLLEVFELTSPDHFDPKESNERHISRIMKEKYLDLPGGLSLEEWRSRLALAPADVVRKTIQATTQLAMSVEVENREVGRRHFKSRFPFLRERRLNDEFHTDTFFPSVKTRKGHTCSQLFIGRNTDYMHVNLLKTESHSSQALKDFGRSIGIPRAIKSDNAKAETGLEWTTWCRKHRVKTTYTEPHSPWQNKAERGIGDLGRMVKRNMERYNVPLSRHGWCQLHCAQVRNHLASRKLNWRTPSEKLHGDTPDISMFRFHFWEPVEYLDPTAKQPSSGWKRGRFLGINQDAGDSMTYFIETDKDRNEGRNVVLTRSNVRHIQRYTPPSGETNDFIQ